MQKDDKVIAVALGIAAVFGIIKWLGAEPQEVSAEILEASIEEAEEGG